MTTAIVLAAGCSHRMGQPKLLLPFAGSTVIARVVDAYLDAPVDRVIVVVRPDSVELRAALDRRAVVFVENPDSGGEMLGSLRCGLRALPPGADPIVVGPADQPSLSAEAVRGLLAGYRDRGASLLVPVHAGRRGHPLVFAARYRDELLASHDGVGLRGLLSAHAAEVTEWETAAAAVLEDLDTPAEYQAADRIADRSRDG